MTTYDLHGMTREEVQGKVRMYLLSAKENDENMIKLITGKGSFIVSEEVIEMCEEYGYDWYHPNNNTGVIIVELD